MAESASSASEEWDPIERLDYALLMVAVMHQAFVAVAVAHLLWCRSWPPYVVKNVSLVCITGVAGIINLAGVVITFGFLDYDSSTLWSNCFFQGLVCLTGAGLYYCTAGVRVYRNYMVLIRHSVDMWRPAVQIIVLQAPIWAATAAFLFPSVARMDFSLNRCTGNARYVYLSVYNYAGLMLVAAAVLMWKLRSVRKQMNEYVVMLFSLCFLMLTVVVFDITVGWLSSDGTLMRRVALANNTVRSALLFWPVITTPMWKYIRRDAAYAEAFTLGFPPAVAPAVLRGSLADQLKVDELWVHFRRIVEERMSPAFPAFFKACMDRDREEGYFERQAKTMDIIGTYVVEDAPSKVDISEECRVRILASEVSRYNIFEEAAAEVLRRMQESCEEAFRCSEALAPVMSKAEKDEAKMEVLRKTKVVPKSMGASAGQSLMSRSDSSRSDRWTGSTATGSDPAKTSFLGCLGVGLLGPVHALRGKKAASKRRRMVRSGTSTSSSMAGTTAIAGSDQYTNRGTSVAPETLGLTSPVQALGWGPASPLPWLSEEDVEAGAAPSREEGNTRTPSTLSVRRDSSIFASRTPNMPGSAMHVPPLPSAPLSTGSLVSSPSPLHERPPLPAPPPPKRAPPSPWLPWRKSPENSVTPSVCSPPLLLEASMEEGDMMVAHRERITSPAGTGMPIAADRGMEPVGAEADAGGTSSVMEVSSSDESSLVVLVLPPSPSSSPSSSSPWSPGIALDQQSRQHQGLKQRRLSGDEGEEQGRSSRGDLSEESGSEIAAKHGRAACSEKPRAITRGGAGRERTPERDGQQEQRRRRRRKGSKASPQVPGSSNSLAVISVSPGEHEEVQSKDEVVVFPVPQWHGCSPPPSCSWSDCSEKRASGATCWSSGVGGGGAILREALMLSADPPLSSPHPSAASSPSPEMLSRSPFRPRFAGAVALSSGLRSSRPMSEASWAASTVSPPSTFSPERLREDRSPLLFSSPPPSGSSSPSPQGLPLLRCRSDDAPPQDEFRIGTAGSQGVEAVRELDLESEEAVPAVVSVSEEAFAGRESLSGHREATPSAKREEEMPLQESNVPPLGEEKGEERHICSQKADARDDMEPPQVEPLRKAPRNRAVQPSQMHPSTASWVSQAVKSAHPPKASQPARALPARAPAWGESLPLSPPAMAPPPPGLTSSCRLLLEHPPRQQANLSPPPAVPPMPLMLELVAVPTYAFAPPSPAGRSTSASPSSVRSSPLMAPRALQFQGALPPPPPARELIPSGPGVPPLWSWSDSTLSGSRSDGRGGGGSSVCASLSPDPSSPLVGIRFLNAGDFASSEVSESGVEDQGRRLSSAGDVAGGVVKLSGGARLGEQSENRDNAVSDRLVTAGEEAVPRAEPGRDGGVGGREGRRPRRYFFP